MKYILTLMIVLVLCVPVFAEKVIYKSRPAATENVAYDEEMGSQNYTSMQEGQSITAEVTDAYMVIPDIGVAGLVDVRSRDKIVIVIKNTDSANGITAKVVAYSKYGGLNDSLILDSSGNSEWAIAAGDSLTIKSTVGWAAIKPMVKNTVGASAGEVRVEYGIKTGN